MENGKFAVRDGVPAFAGMTLLRGRLKTVPKFTANQAVVIPPSFLRRGQGEVLSRIRSVVMGLVVVGFLLAGCDYIDAPYMETNDHEHDTTANPQKVLLFDFTGHTCKSCPKAHKAIDQLKELYGDRLVPIAFHLGYFAKPLTTGKFTTDFRTSEGTLLESHFDFVSFPTGTVQTLNPDQLQPYASWSSLISAGINGDSPVKISITPVYLEGLHAIKPAIRISAPEAVSGLLSLAVYVVEDSIVDWQKDEDFDPMDIPDYVHNHVFRTSLNGLWGQHLGTADGLAKGFVYETEFSKVLNHAWKVENCAIIAFVYREDTKKIIQVEMKSFR